MPWEGQCRGKGSAAICTVREAPPPVLLTSVCILTPRASLPHRQASSPRGARRMRSKGTPDPRAYRVVGRGRWHPPWGCVPPAFSTPSDVWAVDRPQATRAAEGVTPHSHRAGPFTSPPHGRHSCDTHASARIIIESIWSCQEKSFQLFVYHCHVLVVYVASSYTVSWSVTLWKWCVRRSTPRIWAISLANDSQRPTCGA
jgi:hypothetical protein